MQAAPRDHRTPTHDGYIWPLPRDRMDDPGAIRQRMAQDIAGLVAERGEEAVVDTADLVRMGWRPEQVRAYSLSATSAAFAGLSPQQKARRRTAKVRRHAAARRAAAALAYAAQVACIGLFAAATILWSAIGTGTI